MSKVETKRFIYIDKKMNILWKHRNTDVLKLTRLIEHCGICARAFELAQIQECSMSIINIPHTERELEIYPPISLPKGRAPMYMAAQSVQMQDIAGIV
jgi:hypothetical protein